MKTTDQQIDISSIGELCTVVIVDNRPGTTEANRVRVARAAVSPSGAKAFCDIYNRHPGGTTAVIMHASASIVRGRLVIQSDKLPRLKKRKAGAAT
ncbi:MAG TPA: hypothetical protein VG713_06385 [Pirellulales bacterium]|nr:hypothetical protein [Pirellulales bacterium]